MAPEGSSTVPLIPPEAPTPWARAEPAAANRITRVQTSMCVGLIRNFVQNFVQDVMQNFMPASSLSSAVILASPVHPLGRARPRIPAHTALLHAPEAAALERLARPAPVPNY